MSVTLLYYFTADFKECCTKSYWGGQCVYKPTHGSQENLNSWEGEDEKDAERGQTLFTLNFCLGWPLIRRIMDKMHLIQETQTNVTAKDYISIVKIL